MCRSLFEQQNKEGILEDAEGPKAVRCSALSTSSRFGLLIAVLGLNLAFKAPLLSTAIFLFAMTALLLSGASLRETLSRFSVPAGIALLLVATQLLWYGETPIFRGSFWGVDIVLYREGFWEGMALATRVLAGFSAVLLFTMTSSFTEILAFAKEHRVPVVLVELAALIFRFIFVLREDASRIREAQLLRLGYADFPKTVRSVGVLGGKLVIDSFDRAASVYEAMKLRGYES